MKIEQLNLEELNLLDLLRDDNVYYVKVNFRNVKNSDEIQPHPYGTSFTRLNNAKFRELLPLLDSGEAAIVRITMGD